MSDAPRAALSPNGCRRPFIPRTLTDVIAASSQSQEMFAVTFARRRRTGMIVLLLPVAYSMLPDMGIPRVLTDVVPPV